MLAWLAEHKSALEALAIMGAAMGGVVAAFWAIFQFREARLWKKKELAMKMIEEIWTNPKCEAAMTLVDWSNREFEVAPELVERISEEEVRSALRVSGVQIPFSRKEAFVRDCFDNLLDAFQRLEHYIDQKLIDHTDVEYPLEYTVNELRRFRTEINAYMNAYNFRKARSFLNRYPAWATSDFDRLACWARDEIPLFRPGRRAQEKAEA